MSVPVTYVILCKLDTVDNLRDIGSHGENSYPDKIPEMENNKNTNPGW